jgi:hypothetical protein
MTLAGLGEGCFCFDFEVSRLLEVMGIGDEVRLFLGLRDLRAGKGQKQGGK